MKNKISKLQKKELKKRITVIVISVIVLLSGFIAYPQLIYVIPLTWIITGIGNMLGYGVEAGLSDHIGRTMNLIRNVVSYLVDTYKLWKLL